MVGTTLERIFSTLRDELARLVAAEADLEKASRLFSDWLTANRPRLREAWLDLNKKARERDQAALRELEWFLALDDIASDRRFARILVLANPYKALSDPGLMTVRQLNGNEQALPVWKMARGT